MSASVRATTATGAIVALMVQRRANSATSPGNGSRHRAGA
jgi:hypothetical protein